VLIWTPSPKGRNSATSSATILYIEIAPDLAIEVVSPTDHFVRLARKIRQYLERGVRMIWVIDPEDRSATVYRPGVPDLYLTENDTLEGADVLPGFSVRVAELFA
jgi:Uma2 family endonuclease